MKLIVLHNLPVVYIYSSFRLKDDIFGITYIKNNGKRNYEKSKENIQKKFNQCLEFSQLTEKKQTDTENVTTQIITKFLKNMEG